MLFSAENLMGASILTSGKPPGTLCTGSCVGLGTVLDCSKEISLPPPPQAGFEIRNVQLVASRCTPHAMPATCKVIYTRKR